MMMKNILFSFGLIMFSTNVIAADCNLSLQNIRLENTGKRNIYDIFDTGSFSLIQNHLIDVKNNSNDKDCNTILLIKPKQNFYKRQKASKKLDYQILAGKNSASIYENGLAIAINNLKPNEKRTVSYQVKFASGQYVTHGRYTNQFNYSVVEAPLNRAVIYQQKKHDFTVRVDKVAKVSLWGTSNAYQHTVDFGEMTSGETLRLTPKLLVQSTANYSIQFESQYNGHMRHMKGDSKWDVNYDFFLNKRLIPLGSGTQIANYNQPANAVGDRFSMMFKLGNVRSKPAGNYSDVITITVTPSLVY